MNWNTIRIALVVIGVLGFVGWKSFTAATSYPVYIVNGLSQPYDVTVNDETISLAANSSKQIDLPLGKHEISTSGVAGLPATIPVDLAVPFYKLPFYNETAIINPDSLAILVEEEEVYAEEDTPEYEDELDVLVHTADDVYRLAKIDFPFQDFPDEVSMKNSGDYSFKRRVYQYVPDDTRDAVRVVWRNTDPETMVRYGRSYLTINPEDSYVVFLLDSLMEPDDYLALLESRLDDKPILVDWHRAYQSVMERADRSVELTQKYSSLMQAYPDEPFLVYLNGRIERDPDTARALFQKSETVSGQAIGYGYNAMAHFDLSAGSFDRAMDESRKAVAVNPDNANFQDVYKKLLIATGQWIALSDSMRDDDTPLLDQGELIAARVAYLTAAGRNEDASELSDQFMQEAGERYDEDTVAQWRDYLTSMRAYVNADLDTYSQAVASALGVEGAYQVAVLNGDVDGAKQALAELSLDDTGTHLLLYSVAETAGVSGTAQSHLETALEQLRTGDVDDRRAAVILESGTASANDLRDLLMRPELKSIYLVALGVRYPEIRRDAYALASRLNYAPVFPQHSLTRIIEQTR